MDNSDLLSKEIVLCIYIHVKLNIPSILSTFPEILLFFLEKSMYASSRITIPLNPFSNFISLSDYTHNHTMTDLRNHHHHETNNTTVTPHPTPPPKFSTTLKYIQKHQTTVSHTVLNCQKPIATTYPNILRNFVHQKIFNLSEISGSIETTHQWG